MKMKRTIIGFALSLTSSQWLLTFIHIAYTNPTSSWGRGGRFMATLQENGTMVPFIFFFILFILGMLIMTYEFFAVRENE